MSTQAGGIGRFLVKLFGSHNDRVIKKLRPVVEQVNSLESSVQRLSDSELSGKTVEFRDRLEKGESLDDLLPEAFACVREASKRILKTASGVAMRHFDVQLLGGMVLHNGGIAEMATGEGKTLVATLPAYLNALAGPVHVVTVNDYLARRDAEWMAPLYNSLGISVAAVQSEMDSLERKQAYECDITYGTNNEFGFDYLRDNMKLSLAEQVQRGRVYAIVDEVDSILVDEARTPLIISGPASESSDQFHTANRVAKRLVRGQDFDVKEKERSITLTEAGIEKAEKLVGVPSFYVGKHMAWPHLIEQALRAHHLHARDVDYVVRDGEVVIVDEFTGRLMEGRTWSEGLHQAVEAKEGLAIRRESQTMATITLQNYFKLYDKLSGMTGTAITEATEFDRIYNLDVVAIPTNRDNARVDHPDVVYRTAREKYHAIVEEIGRIHKEGLPVLVGTTSIEKSELLAGMLKRRGIPHEVLNAKQHEREAEIVSSAGQKGRVTISTNMAGRGTDIVLGQGIAEKGGLHVVGTERHESRRIDNQLRGRCARQGDPGASIFFLCLEDDLMRRFASERVGDILKKLGMKEGDEISHPWVTKSIERAQKKVENYHYEIRKNLLEYDAVLNEQRHLVYSQRQEVLEGADLSSIVLRMMTEITHTRVGEFLALPEAAPDVGAADDEDAGNEDAGGEEPSRTLGPVGELKAWLENGYGMALSEADLGIDEDVPLLDQVDSVAARILAAYRERYSAKRDEVGDEVMQRVERFILLMKFDEKWRDHLHALEQTRHAIGLRSVGQIDPKIAYKQEGYSMFSQMIENLRGDVTQLVLRVDVRPEDEREMKSGLDDAEYRHDQPGGAEETTTNRSSSSEPRKPIVNKQPKVGRNDLCPCGSGKKYKRCCGARVAG